MTDGDTLEQDWENYHWVNHHTDIVRNGITEIAVQRLFNQKVVPTSLGSRHDLNKDEE